MKNYTNKEDFTKIEKTLSTLGIKSRTSILHKPRKTTDILIDLSKKWGNCTKEDKDLITNMFLNGGEVIE